MTNKTATAAKATPVAKREARNQKPAAYRGITDAQKKEFYKLLINHNYGEAAAQIGMGAFYQPGDYRTIGFKIYQMILENGGPQALGFSEDLIAATVDAIEGRKAFGHRQNKDTADTFVPKAELLDPTDTKSLVLGGRNKAALLLHKKMDFLDKNKQALKDTSISQLGTVFGIFFDKAQIIQGQSTENIAVMSKNIKEGLSPEDSLNMILKMREETVADKNQ